VVGAATTPAAAAAGAVKFPGTTRNPTQGILGAIPNSPARATPTPLPAGVTATPPPPPVTPGPAAKKQIVFYVDTVTSGPGESLLNVDPSISCARTSVFLRGMHIVFRMIAYDNTGTELQTGNVDTMVLRVAGKDVTMRYGRHGTGTPGEAWFWTGTWDVPGDFPIGTVDWSIDAKTKSGLAGSFKELAISSPASNEESRLLIAG
jgi:hypothetical protein